MKSHDKRIVWFSEISLEDLPLVGGKNASLGEMYRGLKKSGVNIPNGFATTTFAYREFLKQNNLSEFMLDVLNPVDITNIEELRRVGELIRQKILQAQLPKPFEAEILKAYRTLENEYDHQVGVAVRSSATAEDLPTASFAGQQESYLNVRGQEALLLSIKKCFASLFTDRAISYRSHRGFDHEQISLSVCVQKMVRSDLAASGVMFTLDTESGFSEIILINAAYGLGEYVVQGKVNPDEYIVAKHSLRGGLYPIISKTCGNKEQKLVYDTKGGGSVKDMSVLPKDQRHFALCDDDIVTLAKWGLMIEEYYTKKHDGICPMDIEWAKDGLDGLLYIVQARPETVHAGKKAQKQTVYTLTEKGKPILSGMSIGQKISSGTVRIIHSSTELGLLQQGEVLVTDKTDPDWEPAMKKSSAIITNRGGRTCHAAIVSRELGLPALVGTENATEVLNDGMSVTVDCSEGEKGFVYEGQRAFSMKEFDYASLPKPKTELLVNIANPSHAFKMQSLPVQGVGLTRIEFVINNMIGIHPMALLRYPNLQDAEAVSQIAKLTFTYDDKKDFFVHRLAEGVATIAAAFYPRPIIVRFSDFKTNEYAKLIGGQQFEPKEENPMLGFRGASRYTHPDYAEAFHLECHAIKRVREHMGFNNVKVMIPFCRTPEEGQKVIQEMAKTGLKQGQNGLEIYVMCEIPSNVILAEKFAEIFDGFSIGSNDLTQLILGVDRDSEKVAPLFNERNEAVYRMIASVIKVAKAKNRHIGICGQAPSDYPEFLGFLIKEGISSISLNSDSIFSAVKNAYVAENEAAL